MSAISLRSGDQAGKPRGVRRFTSIAAFLSGFAMVVVLSWLAADTHAQGTGAIDACVAQDGLLRLMQPRTNCPTGEKELRLLLNVKGQPQDSDPTRRRLDPAEQSLRGKLADLIARVKGLEADALRGVLGNKVTAPFQVVTKAGRQIFSVTESPGDAVRVGVNSPVDGKTKAGIVAAATGGAWFFANSDRPTAGLQLRFGVQGKRHAGLVIDEKGVTRVDLAKFEESGNFGLKTYDAKRSVDAALGSTEQGSGVVLVAYDNVVRARMFTPSGRRGTAEVLNLADQPIATLTEADSAGGLLRIYSAGGEPMVEAIAGAGGFGVVAAGPGAYKSGLGLIGLPGSYIAGKR
jgi:hypothetical protein